MQAPAPPRQFSQNVLLSGHTTLRLGGPARLFTHCATLEELRVAIGYARQQKMRVQTIGGGSNIVFSDHGFDGVVMKVGLTGRQIVEDGDRCTLTVAAGEQWDTFVQWCVAHGLAGVECLSGIPGSVGATPIQNVGAYGQEVSERITEVQALNVQTLETTTFANRDCGFGYRTSRFKTTDRERYVVTAVTFTLPRNSAPSVRYPELKKALQGTSAFAAVGIPALNAVRSAVIALRRQKSMVIDPSDPNTQSAGSFFTNPVLTSEQFAAVQKRWLAGGGSEPVLAFSANDQVKIPAAWLVEHAGFHRGYRKGGAGISTKHALALVNFGGTTRDLLDLASEVEDGVFCRFGIRLEREPVVVP
jgi:UDP-N-acetylmuramate dehydrogenase